MKGSSIIIMQKNNLISFFSMTALLLSSCTIPKEARIFKHETTDWRNSPTVLHAWLDTPLSGIFLTLRKNGTFDHTSSGPFQSFEAGTWMCTNDTLFLRCMSSKDEFLRNEIMVIDRKSSTLTSTVDTSSFPNTLKILTNQLY
jgi:hypothetical protein